MMDLKEFFEEHNNEFLKSNEPTYICQMRVFQKLYQICGTSLINHATHEKIYFGVDAYVFANAFTNDEIIELIQYGLLYDDESESLEMYV